MLEAVCVGKQPVLPSLPRSSYNAPVCACQCKRVTSKLFDFVPNIIPSVVWTHKACVCNEIVALNHRHQLFTGARYTYKGNLWEKLVKHVKIMRPCSQTTIIEHATSNKRKLLQQAADSLKIEELLMKDSRVRMFLKDDKYHTMKIGAPRCIQYRNKRYCLPLATYLHPLEKSVYEWEDASGTRIFAKSRNLIQRGTDIQSKFNFFVNPAVISLDHSKFDCHVNKQLLALEHKFYNACFRSKELSTLLNWQKLNIGSTKNGTKYRTAFTRMSGDQNTGLGNSIINYAMTRQVLDVLKIKYCLYIDGDDFLIFVERSTAHLVDPGAYAKFGMATKLDSVAYEIEHIDFCQTRPVFNGVGYTMVRNPVRMLERIQWGVGKFDMTYVKNYLTSIGLCCLSLGMGLPIEQYVGNTLASLGGKWVATSLHHSAKQMFMRPGKAKLVEPTMQVRLSYERAWGLSPALQRNIEQLQITLDSTIPVVAFPQYGSTTAESEEGYNVPFWSLRAH